MAIQKVYPRGSVLFKDGDKVAHLYLIDSGQVSLGIHRGKAFVEIYSASKGSILGELALFGVQQHRMTAVAQSEVRVIEIPVDANFAAFEALPTSLKLIFKAIGDRYKWFFQEFRSQRIMSEPVPMASQLIPRVFGSLFHAVQHTGKKENAGVLTKGADGKVQTEVIQTITCDWKMLKTYCQRIFLEEGPRLEYAMQILVKIGFAQVEMIQSEDDPKAAPEIGPIHIKNMMRLEQFFEFYQHYSNKSGKQSMLKVDETNYFLVELMLKMTEGQEPDRLGSAHIFFADYEQKLKSDYEITLNKDHFSQLELKGLFVKRSNYEDKPRISFHLQDFQTSYYNWKFLAEIEKLNERGQVVMDEPIFVKRKAATNGGIICPQCQAESQVGQKFCSECGAKLVKAVA